MGKVLSYAVVIRPETVPFRVKRENLYKPPHIKSLRFFPYSRNQPAPKHPLEYSFSITRLLI
jgi:hypothetical protein